MEAQLPPDGWVLGVDEHTACIFDFDAGTATVTGLGVSDGAPPRTVRHGTLRQNAVDRANWSSSSHLVRHGSLVAGPSRPGLGRDAGGGSPDEHEGVGGNGRSRPQPSAGRGAPAQQPPLTRALADRDAEAATAAALDLEGTLHAWSADTFQSDEVDTARAALRRMVVRLGELAAPGLRDPRDVLAPWVEPLLAERAEARRSRRFADGDRIRDRLEALGVEVRDTPGRDRMGPARLAGTGGAPPMVLVCSADTRLTVCPAVSDLDRVPSPHRLAA